MSYSYQEVAPTVVSQGKAVGIALGVASAVVLAVSALGVNPFNATTNQYVMVCPPVFASRTKSDSTHK